MAASATAAVAGLAFLLLLVGLASGQEAFGGLPDASGWTLDVDMTAGDRGVLAVTVMAGLLGGFVLGRLRRFGWDWQLAWAGPNRDQADEKKNKKLRSGIEPVSDEDEEPEVDPATVRGSPAYQRKIRGKAITLLVMLCVGYYLHVFIQEK